MANYIISIIVPVFNVENYLEGCFNSIFNQTIGFENLEVIFVDDCSTDNSRQIIESFVEKHDNVKGIFLDENTGFAGKPRNIGIEIASSQYLMFLDPDDMYLENACEILYEAIISDDLNFVSGNYVSLKRGKWEKYDWNIRLNTGKDIQKISLNNIKEYMDVFNLLPTVWAKIFRRNFIIDNDIRFPEGIPAQDLVFVSECLLKTEKILYINEPVVKYKIRTNESVTSSLDKKTLSGYIKAYKLVFNLLDEYDKEYLWFIGRIFSTSSWIKRFIISDLKAVDKIDLIKDAEIFFNMVLESEYLKPKLGFEPFYEHIYNKRYSDAIKFSKFLYYTKFSESFDDVLQLIKTNDLFFLFDDLEKYYKEYSNDFVNISNFLKMNDYRISLLNFSEKIEFDKCKDFLYDNLDAQIEVINIYDYYLNNEDIKGISKDENGKISLKKINPNLCLEFDSIYDFYNYFINEICFDSDEKPFLFSFSENLDLNTFNHDSAYKIAVLNNIKNENLIKVDDSYLNSLSSYDYVVVADGDDKEYVENDLKVKMVFVIPNIDLDILSEDEFDILNNGSSDSIFSLWQRLLRNVFTRNNFDFHHRQYRINKKYKNAVKSNKQLKSEIKSLKKQVKTLMNENKNLKKNINEIYDSKSWKLTKPMRNMKKRL